MTQYFLGYQKEKDEYLITTIGTGSRFQRIIRKGMTDDEFKQEAIRQFDKLISEDQIADFEVIKTHFIF